MSANPTIERVLPLPLAEAEPVSKRLSSLGVYLVILFLFICMCIFRAFEAYVGEPQDDRHGYSEQ